MTSFKEQLKLLLWKNWILRKRHKTRVFMEFVWPLILFMILMWVRTRGLKQHRPNCHLIEKSLPSVGGFEFFQNFFCTLNNTCHDDYIENEGNKVWANSIFTKVVKEASPVLTDIVSTSQGVNTVGKVWQDLMDFMQVVSGFRTKSETNLIGRIKLKDLMGKYGRKAFVNSVSTYTSLTSSQALEILESDIFLDKVNSTSMDKLHDAFSVKGCGHQREFEIIHFPSVELVRDICDLDKQQKGLLVLFFTNYMDLNGLIQKLKGNFKLDTFMEEHRKITKLLDYDMHTISNLMKIGGILQGFGNVFTRFSKLKGGDLATVLMYEGLCGMDAKGNRSSFGFDPGAATRFDSLRDRLKDWNPDHHYEIDPDISSTCNTMFQRMESMPFTALLWRQVKPFVRGVIYYTPVTPFTEDIMKKVDNKFGKIRELETGINSVVNILHRTRRWLRNHSEEVNHTLSVFSNNENLKTLLKYLGVQPSASQLSQMHSVVKELASSDIETTLERLDFIGELLSELISCIKYNKSTGFGTEWEAVNAGSKLLSAEKLWAVVVFENIHGNDSFDNSTESRHIKYKIRQDSDKVDGTRVARDRLTSKTPRRRPTFDLKYITNGFAYLQEMIEHSIIELVTNKPMDGIATYLQQFPYPCYIYDQFIRAISRTFPLFMVLSWVYASSMIVKSVVMEKELRLREVMKVMGLGNGVIWCGWFIDSFMVMSVSATMLTIILKYGKVIENSDVLLIWTFMLSYTIATISFSFLVSTFFTRANSAAAAGGILFFVSFLPYNMLLIWEDELSWYHTLSSCLIANVAFGFGCNYFARYEEDGVGAQWDRITLKTLPGDDFNLSYCIMMLWVDSILYCALTWYIEAVFPGESGVPKKWNFFLKRSYWKGRTLPRSPAKVIYETVPDILGCEEEYDQPVVEQEPEDLQIGVSVTNLGKTYSNGKVALNDLSINFYENQITSFLGHNGAGKTTTISILTGLFPPTSGTARIYGLDIHKDMDSIRHGTGICPQYNTLFDRLNVKEHMQFYAGLKGKYDDSFEAEFTQMITDLGIPHKQYDFPKNLSGGMKRKLSVACSFIGGSKTIFLDEPTSGVDPYSRRSIWELLLKYKQGRTIILTTHFMDEADLLGDRIAIISQGRLKACGSSLFLKSEFGQGYSLRLVREDPVQLSTKNPPTINSTPSKSCIEEDDTEKRKAFRLNPVLKQTELMRTFVKQSIKDVILVDDVGSEVVFLLPYGCIQQFSALFKRLDDHLQELGISSYGISDTTLEDVFLKITIEDIQTNAESFHALNSRCKRRVMEMLKKLKDQVARKKEPSPINVVTPTVVTIMADPTTIIEASRAQSGSIAPGPLTINPSRKVDIDGNLIEEDAVSTSLIESPEDEFPLRASDKNYSLWVLACIQVYMIFTKRLWNSNRNRKAMFFEIILPAVFIAITLAFTLILPPANDEPPREITPWTYPSPNIIFVSDKEDNSKVVPEFDSFLNGLLGPMGMGTPCINDELYRHICHPSIWSDNTVAQFHEDRKKYPKQAFDACSCSTGSLQCPESVNAVQPPRLKVPTEDYLLDTSKINIPEWIEKTYRFYEAQRYGGFELQIRENRSGTVTEFIGLLDQFTQLRAKKPKVLESVVDDDSLFFASEEEGNLPHKNATAKVYKIWYENRGWVSSVAYLNAMHNIILRENLPDHLQEYKSEFGITVISHPMNLTKPQSKKESIKTAGLGVIHAVCIIFALSFVPASFTVYLIEERKSGGKHLHLVSGVKPITYWIANFLYDLVKYLVPALLCLILFLMFDAKAYIGSPSIVSFIFLLLLYGWASIPAMYPFSFWFSVPSTAFVVLSCMNLFIGVVTTVSTFVLEQFGDPELEKIGAILKQLFLIFPHYCLGRGLMELVRLDMEAIAFDTMAIQIKPKDRFEWENLGKMLFSLILHGIVFFTFNICFEYRQLCYFLFKKTRRQMIVQDEAEDEDVVKERNRVISQPNLESTLRAEKLTKYYSGKKHPAVNGLTFAIERGECFGLLGVNGAGKSSSFKMLTGDVRITSGKAYICGSDVETNLDSARKHFGYCPQEDGLDPLLDAYEVLRLYGRLRGMTDLETEVAVKKLIQMLGLTRFAERRCGTYSGGNRRKLSTAIALIGDPDVVFLDEPTSGMDPVSRRKFWKVILRLVRIGKSVVLTSHSMEECEALCSRIAIMVNGQFMCLGSLQHLKNRFGDGYTVTVRCAAEKQQQLLTRLEEQLPSARLEDRHCSQLKFTIPQLDSKLSDIFNVMYSLREEALIEDYSVSQTTLDDIFVKFASHQKDDMDR